jgi:small-conductance mechanosensitive channel
MNDFMRHSFQHSFSSRPLKVTLAWMCALSLATLAGAQDALGDDFSKGAEIQKRLAAAQEELRAVPAADMALRERLQQLTAACQYHQTATSILEKAKSDRDQASQELRAWSGFPQSAPYSMLLLDEIREQLAMMESSQSASEAQIRIFTAEIETSRDKLDAHQKAERRFAEEANDASSPEARETATRKAKNEQIESRIIAELIARQTLRLEAQRVELEMFRSKAGLAKLQLDAIQGKIVLTPEDLASIRQRIADERAKAVSALTASINSGTPPNPLNSWKIEFLDLENEFWNLRAESIQQKDSAKRKSAIADLAGMKTRVEDWLEIAQLRLNGGSAESARIDPGELRNSIQRVGNMQRLIAHTIADLEGKHLKTPVLDQVSSAVVTLWETELYLAEDVEIVDGKKTSTYRAVTLGKVLRLIVILIVGWIILRYLCRKVRTLLSRRPRFSAASADFAAKAVFVFGLVLLVIYGLNTVRIPLTALAFMGGALAIGIGFGTQTLLKNFISGLILLFERPLRVGDVIEVSAIVGTIKFIGIRASVIQHFDGIETLVPNSILLENQLTNWNFSSSVIRHFILVGVAYGSPTRDVAKILLKAAREHGLVLDDPAPEVRFEDFGADSLVFRLLFWLDTTKTGRDQLASDLRFMIDKAFAEAGIVIAYPQRDIHFDRDVPLRVELTRSSNANPDKGLQPES